MKNIKHAVIIAVSLFVLLGIPGICYAGRISAMFSSDPDAVSGASLVVPDQPSGEYFVFINKEKHADTLENWENFFLEKGAEIIFEDPVCIVADSDVNGIQLAQRYQARLAENQMTVKKINGLMAASKLQWGEFDMCIFSREAAEAYSLESVMSDENIFVIEIKGGES